MWLVDAAGARGLSWSAGYCFLMGDESRYGAAGSAADGRLRWGQVATRWRVSYSSNWMRHFVVVEECRVQTAEAGLPPAGFQHHHHRRRLHRDDH